MEFPLPRILSSISTIVGVLIFDLGPASWIRVRGRLIRASDQSDQRSDKRDMDSQVVIVD